MVVLDTSFIIDYLNNQENAVNYFRKIIENEEEFATTVITIYELEVGVRKSKHKEKNRQIINVFSKKAKVLEINLIVTEIAAKIQDTLAKKGKLIDDFDIFIAAVCIANNQKILTKNVKDFKKIEGLNVETY